MASNLERQRKWLSNPENMAKRRKQSREYYHKKRQKKLELERLLKGNKKPRS